MAVQSPPIEQEDVSANHAATLRSLYSVLALTVRYPAPDFMGDQLFDSLEALLSSLKWEKELDLLRNWLAGSPDPVDELRTAYTGLFITSAPRTTIPPYASIYMDGDGTLQGRTTELTRDYYRQQGFDLADESEPADHLATELDFLAALAGEARFEEEARFLRTLFRPWFARFYEQFMREARHPFYQVSIQLIDFFTKEEQ